MGKGSCLHLENVFRHLSRRDVSLQGMYASHGEQLEASTKSCGEKLAIAIAQRQWAKDVP